MSPIAQYDMYPCHLAQGEVKVTSTSILKINESPVTCGEPARRTDHIDQSDNNKVRDGVWDQNVVVKSGNVVRLDLRDSGESESGKSRVGGSGFLSTVGHGIGIRSEHEFHSLNGGKLQVDRAQDQLRFHKSDSKHQVELQDKSIPCRDIQSSMTGAKKNSNCRHAYEI